MDVISLIPVIVKATKFVFNEVGKWLQQVQTRSSNITPESSELALPENAPLLTQQQFAVLEANPSHLMAVINVELAKTNAYEIESLVKQIQIHRRNLVDFETAETELAVLTPPHIKRGIEREATEISKKSVRLKALLEQVYGRRIENA
ncbi:hypothetical protein [Moorena sp. SIO3I6]|uniref:hypothetical protein n=1 Tax=Moorena sp. SIO3I6 TaxID=2607831 RepID=UPI0013FA403F|nr:hypothetical protein [Moorena sp. SIO3I6]NEP20824.1 hypothetical protein [Moorena sp. SIO3I6]